MWIEFNNNPCGRLVGDCAVRAVSKALNMDWETAYMVIALNGLRMCDMPSSNSTWGSVLRQNGFERRNIPSSYPEDYTADDFCNDNPYGIYVLGFGNHVATVINGNLYDSWDSSNEIPQYVWKKERN